MGARSQGFLAVGMPADRSVEEPSGGPSLSGTAFLKQKTNKRKCYGSNVRERHSAFDGNNATLPLFDLGLTNPFYTRDWVKRKALAR